MRGLGITRVSGWSEDELTFGISKQKSAPVGAFSALETSRPKPQRCGDYFKNPRSKFKIASDPENVRHVYASRIQTVKLGAQNRNLHILIIHLSRSPSFSLDKHDPKSNAAPPTHTTSADANACRAGRKFAAQSVCRMIHAVCDRARESPAEVPYLNLFNYFIFLYSFLSYDHTCGPSPL